MRKLSAMALGLILAACGGDDDGGGGNQAPSVDRVQWTQVAGCQQGVPSDVSITVTVSDPDNMPSELVISGTVTNCTGTISSTTATVRCPQAAPYSGTVTVTDPEGLNDTQAFTIGVCQDGTAP